MIRKANPTVPIWYRHKPIIIAAPSAASVPERKDPVPKRNLIGGNSHATILRSITRDSHSLAFGKALTLPSFVGGSLPFTHGALPFQKPGSKPPVFESQVSTFWGNVISEVETLLQKVDWPLYFRINT
jgi:hypothetical protein